MNRFARHLLVIASLLVQACTLDFGSDWGILGAQRPWGNTGGGSSWGDVDEGSPWAVTEAELKGTLGVVSVDQPATTAEVWDESDYMDVTLHAETETGPTIMNSLYVYGGLARHELGVRLTFDADGNAEPIDYLRVELLGLSGPAPGDWSYERYAQTVRFESTPASAGEIAVSYEAEFAVEPSEEDEGAASPTTTTVSGSFTLVREQ